MKNIVRLRKESEIIKENTVRDIKTVTEKEDDYYKSIEVRNFCNNNYIKYESNDNKNKRVWKDIWMN